MSLPRVLAANPNSIWYNKDACERVDEVRVDGVLVPECVAYDMDKGWAFGKKDGIWQPRVYGTVTVTEKK